MRTKLFVLLAAMSSLVAVTAQAEVRTVVADNKNPSATIEIKEGEVGKCVFAKLTYPNRGDTSARAALIRIEKNGTTVDISPPQQLYGHTPSISDTYYPVVAGPAK